MDGATRQTGNGRAIAVMCVGVAILVTNDAMAKDLVARFHPVQIVFLRNLIALPLIAAVLVRRSGTAGIRSQCLPVHALRAGLAVAASWLFIGSLGALSLATATSIIFLAPVFVALLSMPLLGQPVTALRAGAIGLGFMGALVVLRPGAGSLEPASFAALGAALVHALVMMSARRIDPDEGFWTMTFWMSLFPGLICAASLAMPWPEIEAGDIALFVGMAVCGTLGIALISQAFRMGDAAAVAPFDYTALIWASALGWAIWGTVPDGFVWLGAGIIAASGLALILGDRHGTR